MDEKHKFDAQPYSLEGYALRHPASPCPIVFSDPEDAWKYLHDQHPKGSLIGKKEEWKVYPVYRRAPLGARAAVDGSGLPQEQAGPKQARGCTCVDHCRGGSGLAQGWFCKMAGTRFDSEAPKLAAQEGAAGEGGAG